MSTCRKWVWSDTAVKKMHGKKYLASCYPMYTTAPQAASPVFYRFFNLSISAWEHHIPHPSPPALLLPWFPRVRSCLSSHIWSQTEPGFTRFCLTSVLYLEKRKTNRCTLAFFLINLTSSLWEEKIIERGKKEKQINEMLRTKLLWEWEGGGGGRLLTVGSHICIKQPDTSGVISQHTETKNNNRCERDGPNERCSFALQNKAEHFQRRVTF